MNLIDAAKQALEALDIDAAPSDRQIARKALRAAIEAAEKAQPVATYMGADWDAASQFMAECADLEPGTELYTHAPVPEGMVLVPAEVVNFLRGIEPFEGVWFGEWHPGEVGTCWWRRLLPKAEVE